MTVLNHTSSQVEVLSPAPRGGHASVAIGRRFIVFGGADRAPNTFNDLWVLETGAHHRNADGFAFPFADKPIDLLQSMASLNGPGFPLGGLAGKHTRAY
jgi:hypothetical protein